ncbi:MAG: hypothetical protein NPIRA02_04040 [Nitrospirales bacterium]|nr:MAG: hypothetical protein NPIRA02_04040 [Nitrospirales bacterium]
MNHSLATTIQGYFEEAHQSVLDRVQHLDLELQAVSIGLKNKLAETQSLREQMQKFFEYLPIAAILMNHDRVIQQVNRVAKDIPDLETHMVVGQSFDEGWRRLGWPAVPCTHVTHHGRLLYCSEEVLGEPGTVPCLIVRFIREEHGTSSHDQKSRSERMSMMGEHVAKVSHDLRNSLTSIELFASLVERRVCNDVEHQRVGRHLVQAIQTLEQFVSSVLSSATTHEAKIGRIDLHVLLDQVERLLAKPLKERGVTIQRTVASEATFIDGDSVLVQRACLNILRNAISASLQGGSIEVDCRRVMRPPTPDGTYEGGDEVILSVRDHGCGMSAETLSHVFQPFYSKETYGTGLGLSIVKDVMDAHHGTIDVRSREEQGTTVSLRFPQQRRSA